MSLRISIRSKVNMFGMEELIYQYVPYIQMSTPVERRANNVRK